MTDTYRVRVFVERLDEAPAIAANPPALIVEIDATVAGDKTTAAQVVRSAADLIDRRSNGLGPVIRSGGTLTDVSGLRTTNSSSASRSYDH